MEEELKFQDELRAKLKGSLLLFTKYFYELRTGRPFVVSLPPGRESHNIIVCRELTKFFKLETKYLMINMPPGHGKSTHLVYFVAWAMAHYPDSNFLYISYAKSLAEKHTAEIKAIMSMREYQQLFGVSLAKDSTAKGNFKTSSGGSVNAYGSAGGITGHDAGLPNMNRFSGGVIIDDAHKPDEVFSDTIRQGVIDNYNQTIKPRPRGDNVGMVCLGQRLHEDDLPAFLENKGDGFDWEVIKLRAIDEAGNVLAPNIISKERLLNEQDKNPYVYSSQYQQTPTPAGGGIFKKEDFITLDMEPPLLGTFITADTAETDKEYNDATVFSFWGIYQPVVHGRVIPDLYALHWLDCWELRVEPKDLENSFFDFWAQCMRHTKKPILAAIEKKSTGTTLVSRLKSQAGIKVYEIERTRKSGSKVTRFLHAQPFIAQKLVTLPTNGKHTKMCIEHMCKITATDTHRHDDVCDTAVDAIKLGLEDRIVLNQVQNMAQSSIRSRDVMENYNNISHLRNRAYNEMF